MSLLLYAIYKGGGSFVVCRQRWGSAPDPRNLFEKRLIKNFHRKVFYLFWCCASFEGGYCFLLVSLTDGMVLPIAAGGHHPICSTTAKQIFYFPNRTFYSVLKRTKE